MKNTPAPMSPATVGILSAVAAFSLWGVFPLYWAQISFVPALEVIWHRILWGGVLAWIIVWIRRRHSGSAGEMAGPGGLVPLFPRGRAAWLLVLNGSLLAVNWFVYVWAVTSGRTLEASLGYYINPLVSVLFGMIFFAERLTPLQWVAVGSAATGVLYMTLQAGLFPWVSLALAGTFGLYGVIKKKTVLSSIHGLAVELTPVMVLAAGMVIRGLLTGTGNFAAGSTRTTLFLLGASVVTVAPLLLFGIATRRIRLADVGFLQYIAPTLMFVVAVAVFGDPVGTARMVGFAWVWAGLGIYTYSNLRRR
jgi:chloramphenicol-sensitive protein RarD